MRPLYESRLFNATYCFRCFKGKVVAGKAERPNIRPGGRESDRCHRGQGPGSFAQRCHADRGRAPKALPERRARPRLRLKSYARPRGWSVATSSLLWTKVALTRSDR
jgi:hypothetical protein